MHQEPLFQVDLRERNRQRVEAQGQIGSVAGGRIDVIRLGRADRAVNAGRSEGRCQR